MKVTQEDLRKIVEQASTLRERLSIRFVVDEQESNQELIQTRLERWCQVVAKGDPDTFAKRLAWDNLDVDSVNRMLGSVRLAEGQPLPAWIETLREVLEADWEAINSAQPLYWEPENPIPFEDLYPPLIEVASRRLRAEVGTSWELLSETAQIAILRQLLSFLASLCARTLQLEFLLYRAKQKSAFSLFLGRLVGGDSNEQYQNFIKTLQADKLLSFFQKYSVLARFLATAIDLWVEEKAEFLQRLAADLPRLEQTFQQGLGTVAQLKLDLSDRHHRGRSVIALEFTSGLKLIYKPRGLKIESTYFQLLDWCNHCADLLPFKILKVIDRSSYGWMEYVPHLPCEDEAAARRYYQRAGMVLCLLYLLEGGDCHYENLIASGEQPILIDLETLMHPYAQEIDPKIEELGAQYLANQQFYDSVLRTGLLPQWEFDAEAGIPYDISGLGGVDQQNFPLRVQRWHEINTDRMVLKSEFETMGSQTNTVFLKDTALSPGDYVEEMSEGFEQMYGFLCQQREFLLAPDSPLAPLAEQSIRFLFRNSQVYASILDKSLQTQCLRDGVDQSMEIDVLSRALLAADNKPAVWSLLAVERESLEHLDIPYFTAHANSDALSVNSELAIAGYFKKPSYQSVLTRLQQLNKADLAQQIAIIRGSFYSRSARAMTEGSATPLAVEQLEWESSEPLTQTELVAKAVEIARELQQRAIQAPDGSVSWIGMGYLPTAGRLQLQPLDYNLYDGVCGVAFFLGALAKITGEAEFHDLALAALQNLKKQLQTPDQKFLSRMTQKMGIGAGSGLGSIAYSLVKLSQFLQEPELLSLAKIAAVAITPARIAEDGKFDLIGGAAGAILSLLALYQVEENAQVLQQAIACGNHLLKHRSASPQGLRAWQTIEDKLMTGFSHGAAGIAYALLRLQQVTQESIFEEAALEAIAYERSQFDAQAQNWYDVRSSQPFCLTNWCHGAPGIGLSRLGSLKIVNREEMRQEAEIAVQTTQKFGLQPIDHLCCGNLGRSEVLLVAGQQLGQPEWQEIAQKQAAAVVKRAEKMGTFQLFPEVSNQIYNPGFFQGTSGIGYQLLRLAYPDLLPCVLMWN